MVTVRFHAGAREAVGAAERQIDLPAGATVAHLKQRLLVDWPALAAWEHSLLFAVHEEYATPEQPLADGDVVSCFPPVSGG